MYTNETKYLQLTYHYSTVTMSGIDGFDSVHPFGMCMTVCSARGVANKK